MKWWDVRLNFFLSSPFIGCYTEMNIFSCQEEKVIRFVLLLSMFLFYRCLSEANGLVHVLLLSMKTFCLGLRSTYCIVWAESLTKFKEFPPTVYHFR